MLEQTNTPRVSIGMPIYNGEKYMREALDSLLVQTFTDFELVISDNSSTDGTSQICREFASRDSRVRYIRQETNIGPIANFRFVLQEASGEFFMWAAHDDIWEKNWLQVLVGELEPSDLAVRGKAININENGDILNTTIVTSFKKNQVLKAFFDDEKNCRALYWYALFNSKLLNQIDLGLLNNTFGADASAITHLVQFGNLRVTEKTSQYYRYHTGSATTKFKKDWFGLRRYIYHLFPINTYFYSIRIVKLRYKLLILIAIPFRYLKSQLSIAAKLLHLVFTGRKY